MSYKIFLDCEFIERPRRYEWDGELISIGLVDQNGNEYYAISNEYKYNECSEWVKENVIKQMYDEYIDSFGSAFKTFRHLTNRLPIETFQQHIGKSKEQIAKDILLFVDMNRKSDTTEFWSYYADFDWVAFAWLFGAMIYLPPMFPMYCNDIRQLMNHYPDKGKLPNPEREHNALADAKWTKDMYYHLTEAENLT